jgi:tyrosine-protein phosphatase
MGPAWRSKYSNRKRTGSIASNMTGNSKISENLVEEDEEPELLGVGGGFGTDRERRRSADTLESSTASSPDKELEAVPRDVRNEPLTARPLSALRSLPSAPAWKSSFNIPPRAIPKTAVRTTFDTSSRPLKLKHRPPPIGLPPVPPSPVTIVVSEQEPLPVFTQPPSSDMISMSASDSTSSPSQSLPDNASVIHPSSHLSLRSASLPKPTVRKRTESRKLPPPPLHLRKVQALEPSMLLSPTTPHQTLLVFPPSPTLTTRTPSAVMLTTAAAGNTTAKGKGKVPFPSLATPRVSTFKQHGRTRSFIGTPMTPTTAFTKVEAKGYVGIQ